jgi:hypothetical protein
MSRHAARPEPPARPARPVVGQPAWKAHLGAAALAAVVCPALVVAAHVSRLGLLAGLGALQALLVLAWVLGTGLPGRIGGLLIGAAVAGGADAVLHLRDRASLSGLLGVLGLTVPALLLHQLSRGVVRVRVTESMSGVAALSAAGASAASYLALARAVEGTRLVSAALAAAGVGLVAGRLIDIALPVPRFTAEVPYGLLAVGASIALGATTGAAHSLGARQLEIGEGALLGAGTAGVAALVAVAVGYIGQAVGGQSATAGPGDEPALAPPAVPATRTGRLALAYLRVGLPLACTGPVAYLLGLWVMG